MTEWLNKNEINADKASELRNYFSAIFPTYFLFSDVVDGEGSSSNDEKITHYLSRLAINHKVSANSGQLSPTSLSKAKESV